MVSLVIIFLRTLIVFAALILSLRIMGKRQLGELEPIELVVAVLISNIASQPLQDIGTPLLYGIVPVLTLLACQVLISGLTMKSLRFRALLAGKPSILIKNGAIQQAEMRKNRITLDELAVELRQSGVSDLTAVKYAILETNGKLSILSTAADAPVTPKQLSLTPEENGLPVAVVCDGRVISDNLRYLGHDEAWLQERLDDCGAGMPGDVYYMSVDENDHIYLLMRDDA